MKNFSENMKKDNGYQLILSYKVNVIKLRRFGAKKFPLADL